MAKAVPDPLRPLRILAIVSIAVPLLLIALFGAYRLHVSSVEADQRISRSLRVAHEHASRVLAGSEALQDRIYDLVQGRSLAQLHDRASSLQGLMRTAIKDQPQIQSIRVIGSDGQTVADSELRPAAPVEMRSRKDFQALTATPATRFVSEPTIGDTGERVLNISQRFYAPDGSFGGLIVVSLQTGYFERFYSDLVAQEPGLAVNLFREEGAIYVRWPLLPGAPERLGPTSPTLQRLAAGEHVGRYRGVSSVDRQDRIIAYRRVDPYPVYVGTGMNLTTVRNTVLKELASLLALALLPFAAVFYSARLALRRTREALASSRLLTEETQTRLRAEEALLQAQKLEAMGRLTGGVAHDFNNALMVISNNTYLLKRHMADTGNRQLESISRAVASATKLTRQLLAFSRRQPLIPEQVRLQDQLPAVQELIAPVLGARIQLSVAVAPDTRTVLVDQAELELALLNLGINACDAMPDGGSFTIRAYNGTQELPDAPLGTVVVEATDTGTGIAPEIASKVFEPFFTTKPLGKGTGLGLSQVYGLCQRAGGRAEVESQLGHGSTVRLLFPASTVAQPGVTTQRRSVDRRLGKSLLIVEDNDEVAAALVLLVEALGCKVVRVDSASAAREWLATQTLGPDLVLSDVMMAGDMDGLGLAQFLREAYPGLPVVMMTGYAVQIDEITAQGFTVLPKPFSPEVLSAAIAQHARAG